MLQLLRSLDMPDWLIKCASGDIAPPEFTFDSPCKLSYGFPPAILPIWSNSAGPDYIGVLHHWFGGRKTTFVRYHTETRRFAEIARTSDQLRIWMVFDFLRNVPDVDEVAAIATATGLCSREELESFFADYQRDQDIARHPSFANNLPGRLVIKGVSTYSGDFPFGAVDLARYCDFEVPNEIVTLTKSVPPWFNSKNNPELFQRLLSANDLQSAWFCLNSSGWTSAEMKSAVQQLAAGSDLCGLSALSDWLVKNIPNVASY